MVLRPYARPSLGRFDLLRYVEMDAVSAAYAVSAMAAMCPYRQSTNVNTASLSGKGSVEGVPVALRRGSEASDVAPSERRLRPSVQEADNYCNRQGDVVSPRCDGHAGGDMADYLAAYRFFIVVDVHDPRSGSFVIAGGRRLPTSRPPSSADSPARPIILCSCLLCRAHITQRQECQRHARCFSHKKIRRLA